MMINNIAHLTWRVMPNKLGRSNNKPVLEKMHVQLIATNEADSETRSRRSRVHKVLTLMYVNLQKRGRPTKRTTLGDKDVA